MGLGDSCQRGADNPHDFIFWRIRNIIVPLWHGYTVHTLFLISKEGFIITVSQIFPPRVVDGRAELCNASGNCPIKMRWPNCADHTVTCRIAGHYRRIPRWDRSHEPRSAGPVRERGPSPHTPSFANARSITDCLEMAWHLEGSPAKLLLLFAAV